MKLLKSSKKYKSLSCGNYCNFRKKSAAKEGEFLSDTSPARYAKIAGKIIRLRFRGARLFVARLGIRIL
jgi:hypothetical protein